VNKVAQKIKTYFRVLRPRFKKQGISQDQLIDIIATAVKKTDWAKLI
jgi:hypothetical protein